MDRRTYSIEIKINGRRITSVVIDPHYERKHRRSINDELILELVGLLDGLYFDSDDEDGRFEYFVYEGLWLRGRKYRLIWMLERGRLYIGVVNVFRRK